MGGMRVDRSSRLISADARAVLAAFADADLFLAWLPPAGMTGRLDRFDPRTGGGFHMVLTYDEAPAGGGKAGDGTDVVEARIAEFDAPRRIVWEVEFPSDDPAASGVMTMVWTLTPDDGGTHVSVEASDVPDAISPEAHAAGLASSLANLAAVVERPA